MIAVSTSVDPTISSSTAIPCSPNRPAAHFAATAAKATNSDEAERRHQRDRIAGRRSAHRIWAPCDRARSPRPRRPTSAGRMQHARTASSTRVASTPISSRTRRYMTAVASAIPAFSAPPLRLAAEPLRERLGDRGRAVGAADQRGGDGPVPLAEDAVGDIAEEREAGDQHDHQPQLLRVPRAERAVMAARAGTAGPRRR